MPVKSMKFEDTPDLGYHWWITIRNAPGVIRQIPMEAKLSYPVGAPGELRCFHYRIRESMVQRPFTRIRATLPLIDVVEVAIDQRTPLYREMPETLGKFQVEWSHVAEKAALNLLPSLMERYPDEPAGALGQQYWTALTRLQPQKLAAVYEALSPDFTVWLRGEV